MSGFTDAVTRNLRGVHFFSVGACPGCAECGLDEKECRACDGTGKDEESDTPCTECKGTGKISPTDHEVDCANESHFSWSSCDSCGSSLGGDRHPAHGVIAATEEEARAEGSLITHFDVCTDCVMYHANGDLPEDWEEANA